MKVHHSNVKWAITGSIWELSCLQNMVAGSVPPTAAHATSLRVRASNHCAAAKLWPWWQLTCISVWHAADSTALLGELVSRGLDAVYWTSLAHMTTISVDSWAGTLCFHSSRWLAVAAGAQAVARSPAADPTSTLLDPMVKRHCCMYHCSDGCRTDESAGGEYCDTSVHVVLRIGMR
jgi:hypothetical protein